MYIKFPENLNQFFETHDELTSESDYDKIEEDSCSEEELENTSDEDTTSTDPNKTLSMALKDLVKNSNSVVNAKKNKLREVYENDIQKAKSSDHSSFHVFSFDFAQNIELSHNPQQPGSWYYLSLLKIHQFGLVDEDNCSGQNKNFCLLWYLLWLCDTKIFHKIDYQFQIKGYIRNSVDHGFGHTKQEYAKSEAWCIDHLVDIINRSASNNISVNLEEHTELFCDWTSALTSKTSTERFFRRKTSRFWNKICPYCPTEFQDELCPRSTDDAIKRVGKLKGDRAKEAQSKRKKKNENVNR
ncbi:13187_t:CDS:2 [Dentiscutata heterogama]|uniref:13187_t:CDS:1 n=1 Tax=Dentiscutata heterogama TaxID=1316150 RepID=A0ACA9KBX1_9GLOM|nr:13187_t:CDS:2 [Dentiscutata heterogama]